MNIPKYTEFNLAASAWKRRRFHWMAIFLLIAVAGVAGKIVRHERNLEHRAQMTLLIAAHEETDFRAEYGRYGDITEIIAAHRARFQARPAPPPPVFTYQDTDGTIREAFPLLDPQTTEDPFARVTPENWHWRVIETGVSHYELRLEEDVSLPGSENCFSIKESGIIASCEKMPDSLIELGY